MYYINPYNLLEIESDNIADVDVTILKKAKRKLLSELELSETNTIQYKGTGLTKADCLIAIDDLDNKDKRDFHIFIYQNKDLNNFLSKGELGFFYRYKVESIYKLNEFIDFISAYFAQQYNKQLSRYYKEGSFEIVKLILSVTPIVNESGKELCYRGTYLFLKEIEKEIVNISKDIENKRSTFFINNFEGISEAISNRLKINLLNILPNYFQNVRNQLAEAINSTAIEIHNNYYKYKPADELMNIAYNIFTDGLIEQTILKNQLIIKKHHEDKQNEEEDERQAEQYSELFTSYRNIAQQFDKVIEEIDNKSSYYIAKRFSGLKEYIISCINISELNSLPDIFNNLRTRIAIQIKRLSVTIWNDYEYIEPSFKLIQLASAIKVDDETRIKIKTDFDTLKAIEERKRKYGKPISSAPSLGTTNGVGTKIYEDTLYFVLFFIPIFPISRYSLENSGSNSYRFFGKLELHKWQKVWQWGLGIGLILLIILGIANSNSSHTTNYSSPSTDYNSAPTNNNASTPSTGEVKFDNSNKNNSIITPSYTFVPLIPKVTKHKKVQTSKKKIKSSNAQSTREIKF